MTDFSSPEKYPDSQVSDTYPERVSVLVPVYQAEATIARCLDSLLAQTWPDIEIIAVNDGSTDSSGAILDQYAARHPSIHVIHQENSGVCAARNRAIQASTGSYIGFCDNDDYVSPFYYERLLQILQETRAGISVGNFVQSVSASYPFAPVPPEERPTRLSGGEALARLVRGEGPFRSYVWNKLYDRRLFDGISYPEDRAVEDQFVTYRLFHRAEKIAYTEWAGYCYVTVPGSLSRRRWLHIGMDYLDAWEEIRQFCREHYPELEQTASDQLISAALYTRSRMLRGHAGQPEEKARLRQIVLENRNTYYKSTLPQANLKRKVLAFLYPVLPL